MNKSVLAFFWLVAILPMVAACGRNNGTSNKSKTPDSGDAGAKPKIEGLDLAQTVLSNDGRWRIAKTWGVGPSFGQNSFIENKMQLLFVTASGAAVDSLSDVAVVPYMPQHGHGTGNIHPKVTIGELGAVAVTDIWFIMAGDWEVTVKGNVDGQADQASFHVDVKAQ